MLWSLAGDLLLKELMSCMHVAVSLAALFVHSSPISSQAGGYSAVVVLYLVFFAGSLALTKYLFRRRLQKLDIRPFIVTETAEEHKQV